MQVVEVLHKKVRLLVRICHITALCPPPPQRKKIHHMKNKLRKNEIQCTERCVITALTTLDLRGIDLSHVFLNSLYINSSEVFVHVDSGDKISLNQSQNAVACVFLEYYFRIKRLAKATFKRSSLLPVSYELDCRLK